MKQRFIWAAAIVLAAVLYLFENNAGTLTVLAGVLAVPILGMIPLMGKGIDTEVALNPAQKKGQTAKVTLTVTNQCRLPKPRLRITLSCRNLRTGQAGEHTVELSLLPGQRKQLPFTVGCPHCGHVRMEVINAELSDVFGLFSRRLSCHTKAGFTVVPQLFEPSVSLDSQDMAMPDSDTYSPVKPGDDPGETFAVREYVPGDAIRKIHWKLSEKTDKLMVREFGLPVINEVALLLETAGAETPDETDAITEVFASVSSELIRAGIHHHVYWPSDKTDGIRDFMITAENEFAFMLEELMELPPGEDGSVTQRFLEIHPHCPYSHVIIVGSQIPPGTRNLYNGNRVSILVPRRDSVAEGLQSDGTHVLSFSADSYAMDLCRMEV